MFPLLWVPPGLRLELEATSTRLLQPTDGPKVDFSIPKGEAALVAPDSLSWRIFKNPIALMIGGIAAVLLELGDPAVRTGVWEHSSFSKDPLRRLQRTGLAAMVTVYGARSVALPMIQAVVRMHSRIAGVTPAGEAYCANDVRLLNWVHATASFGFVAAYDRYVTPLEAVQWDTFFNEGRTAAVLYGANQVPASRDSMDTLFDCMRDRLQGSPIVFDFLRIMRTTSTFPPSLRWLQPIVVRAAIDLLPRWIRLALAIPGEAGLRLPERAMIHSAGALAERVLLSDSPPAQACLRLGLPPRFLYR